MVTIATRLKLLLIVGLALFITFVGVGIFLLNVTDGSTKEPADVFFILSAFGLLIVFFDIVRKPNKIILYDSNKNQLLISSRGKVMFPSVTPKTNNSKYFVIPISDITGVVGYSETKEGNKHFGMIGYMATAKVINELIISFNNGSEEIAGMVKNVSNPKSAEKKIQELIKSN